MHPKTIFRSERQVFDSAAKVVASSAAQLEAIAPTPPTQTNGPASRSDSKAVPSALPSLAHVRRVVVAIDDRFTREVVQSAIAAVTVETEIDLHESRQGLEESLRKQPADMIVAAVSLRDGDVLDTLWAIKSLSPCDRILVLSDRSEAQVLHSARALGVRGAIDTRVEGVSGFQEAFCRVGSGGNYWSPTFLHLLRGHGPHAELHRILTPNELLLFSILGDGTDDHTAAELLNLTAQGVHAYRKRLHRKLGVQHKGSLMTLALRFGLVRVTAEGVQRPGLEMLRARCPLRKRTRFPNSW